MKIITVRHGETDWNVDNLVQGSTDNPLNDHGLEQAKEIGENLASFPVSKIYSSPMIRSIQTTKALADALDFRQEIQYTPALREQNFGVFEGMNRDDPEYQKEKHLFFKRFENGESFLDVAARVYPFLDDLIQESEEDDIIVLSTHGGICRMIASYFTDLNNEEFARFFMENCQPMIFEFKKADWIPSSRR